MNIVDIRREIDLRNFSLTHTEIEKSLHLPELKSLKAIKIEINTKSNAITSSCW